LTNARSFQNNIIDRSLVFLMLPCLGAASCFLVANAQADLRPPITGTAKTSASTTDTTNPPKLPIAAIVNQQVDVEIFSASAPSKKLKALRVKVRNRSDSPLIFDGDRSFVTSQKGGQLIARCISQKQLDTIGRPPTTFGQKFSADLKDTVTAAASVGIVQTVKTVETETGPIEKRYEYDRERQVNEESRFGRRLIYPGDTTDGNIYFPTDVPLENALLQVPIKSFYDTAEATLSKPIRTTIEGNRQ
jgi:hypothetical protein